MARVVLVHGINNTFGGPASMTAGWVPALLDGVALAGLAGRLSADDVDCAFYGDVFRRPGRRLGDGDELPGLGAGEVIDPAEAQLLLGWWEEAAAFDGGVIPPGLRTLGVADGAQAALAALAGSQFLAGAAEDLLAVWLGQVRAYFTQSELRQTIQQRFADAIREDTETVVAHSLGSVVAYEGLCAHPEWPVTRLVTLGSPLGIRNVVLDRLIPQPALLDGGRCGQWPAGVREWVNIADRMDFVALVKKLATVFGQDVVDVAIDNGVRMHDVRRYLSDAWTGRAVVGGDGGGEGS